MAAAAAGGDVTLEGAPVAALGAALFQMGQTGLEPSLKPSRLFWTLTSICQ